MQPRHYRDLIVRAVRESDTQLVDMLVAHLVDAERAKQVLRAKGYGEAGMSASATAAQVPGSHPQGE
jgi:hypothetical protein